MWLYLHFGCVHVCVCTCAGIYTFAVCVRVEKARKTDVKRDGVNRKDTAVLRFCLKLPILWGVLAHILSHVTKQKKDRPNQRYATLVVQFSH